MKHLYSFNESIVVPPFGDLEDLKHMLLDLQDEGYEVEVEENKPNSAPAFGKIPGSYDILVSSNLWNASPRQQIVRPRQGDIQSIYQTTYWSVNILYGGERILL